MIEKTDLIEACDACSELATFLAGLGMELKIANRSKVKPFWDRAQELFPELCKRFNRLDDVLDLELRDHIRQSRAANSLGLTIVKIENLTATNYHEATWLAGRQIILGFQLNNQIDEDEDRLCEWVDQYATCIAYDAIFQPNIINECAAAIAGLPKPDEDGPIPPNAFKWSGVVHHGLAPVPWKLLDFCWKSSNHSGPYDGMAEAVWGDRGELFSEDAVKSAAKKVREFFRDNDIPLTCSNSERSRSVCIKSESV